MRIESQRHSEASGNSLRSSEKLKSRSQEQIFEQAGITPEFVNSRLEILRTQADLAKESWVYSDIGHEDAFYINSSDSLVGMQHHLDVKDQAVLTVGGSGDFAQLFASKGARQVDVFDMSWSACLINEFKMSALRELSFTDYQKALGFCSKLNSIPKNDSTDNLGNQDEHLLKQAAKGLTPATKRFIDSFFEPANKEVFRYFKGANSFVRSRDIAYIGDVVKTPADFTVAQTSAQKCQSQVHRLAIDQLSSEMLNRYDQVYITNVGYRISETISYMKNLIKKGAPSVVASWQNHLTHPASSRYGLSEKNSIKHYENTTDQRFFTNQNGDIFTAEWDNQFYEKVPDDLFPVPEWFDAQGLSQPLLPGMTFSLNIDGKKLFFILRSFPDKRHALANPKNPTRPFLLPGYSWIVEMSDKLNPSLRSKK